MPKCLLPPPSFLQPTPARADETQRGRQAATCSSSVPDKQTNPYKEATFPTPLSPTPPPRRDHTIILSSILLNPLVRKTSHPTSSFAQPHNNIKMADAKSYKYSVAMTCGGCSGAVTRVLNKLKESGGTLSYPPPFPQPLPSAFHSLAHTPFPSPPGVSVVYPNQDKTKRTRKKNKNQKLTSDPTQTSSPSRSTSPARRPRS